VDFDTGATMGGTLSVIQLSGLPFVQFSNPALTTVVCADTSDTKKIRNSVAQNNIKDLFIETSSD
jgi:hypothetical protein